MVSLPPARPASRSGFRASLNRNVVILLLGGALVQAPIGFMFLSLPIYMGRLGYGAYYVGWVFQALGFVAVGLAIPFGIAADRYGRRLFLGAGGVVGGSAFLLLSYVTTFEGFLVFGAVLGAAEALYLSTWNALLADVSVAESRTSVFSLSFFIGSLAMGGGSLVGILADQAIQAGLSPQAAYGPLFLGFSGSFVTATLSVLLVHPPERQTGATEGRGLLPQRSMGIILRFLTANAIVGLGAGLIIPLFSKWFEAMFSVAETFTGPLFAVSAVANGFAFLLAPRLADRFGMVGAIVGAQAIATVLLLSMTFTGQLQSGLLVAAVLYVLRNALMNMSWPVATSFLMSNVHPDERSSAGAITTIAFRLPNSASTPAGGYLLDINPSLPIYFTTLLYAIGTAAFWYFFKAYRGSGENDPGSAST